MDYTNNYHLPQWVKSDRIMMDDFNQMCANIDSNLAATAQTAVNAQSAASAAQSAANAAKSAAANAQSTANTARQEAAALPYAVGTYTGTGATLSIKLGFRPSFVIITGAASSTVSDYVDGRYFGATGGHTLPTRCKLTATGFTVYPQDQINGNYPSFNYVNRVYDYIAFK